MTVTEYISVPQVTVQQAFLHFYGLDISNAAIHCAPPRFSPITFRLQEALNACEAGTFSPDDLLGAAWDEVSRANGTYAEDPGR